MRETGIKGKEKIKYVLMVLLGTYVFQIQYPLVSLPMLTLIFIFPSLLSLNTYGTDKENLFNHQTLL